MIKYISILFLLLACNMPEKQEITYKPDLSGYDSIINEYQEIVNLLLSNQDYDTTITIEHHYNKVYKFDTTITNKDTIFLNQKVIERTPIVLNTGKIDMILNIIANNTDSVVIEQYADSVTKENIIIVNDSIILR